MIGHRKHWYGKEVEGRYTDLETLFIADLTDIATDGITSLGKIPAHIYLCAPAVRQLINGIDGFSWETILSLKDDNTFFTLEVNEDMLGLTPPIVRIHCHMLLMFNCYDARLLKKTDSIKIVYDDYSLYTSTVHNMQHVTPDDYKFDRYE